MPVKRLFSLTVQDHPLLWNPKPNIARLFYKHGIRVNQEVKLLPKYCLAITILPEIAGNFLSQYGTIA